MDCYYAILGPSLPVILSVAKNLATLGVNSAKDLRDSSSSRCIGAPQNDSF
jgi:hypothetical protein